MKFLELLFFIIKWFLIMVTICFLFVITLLFISVWFAEDVKSAVEVMRYLIAGFMLYFK